MDLRNRIELVLEDDLMCPVECFSLLCIRAFSAGRIEQTPVHPHEIARRNRARRIRRVILAIPGVRTQQPAGRSQACSSAQQFSVR